MTRSIQRAEASLTVILPQQGDVAANVQAVAKPSARSNAASVLEAATGADVCETKQEQTSLATQAYSTSTQSVVYVVAPTATLAERLCPQQHSSASAHGQALCLAPSSVVRNDALTVAVPADLAAAVTTLNAVAPELFATQLPLAQVQNQLITLAQIQTLASNMASAKHVLDGEVDVYVLVFPTFDAAVAQTFAPLVDAVAQNVQAAFVQAYRQNVVSQTFYLTADEADAAADDAQLCPEVDNVVIAAAGVSADVITVEQIRSYQIVLWLVLALVATSVAGFAATMNMHIIPDAALVGGVATYWTTKK